MILFDIITLFPQILVSPLGESILKRAQRAELIKITIHDVRSYAEGRHQVTDDAPFGGGAGMVMKVEPIVKAIEQLKQPEGSRVLLMSPQGTLFNQKIAEKLSAWSHLILICGRYEGVDERLQFFIDEELSIGDYILTGGELPALVVIDAVSRLVPGVIGEPLSVIEDTFSCSLLKYPQYTRPRNFRGLEVPEILLSGNHEKIRKWRRQQALKKTLQKRPDLIRMANLNEEDKQLLQEVMHDTHKEI